MSKALTQLVRDAVDKSADHAGAVERLMASVANHPEVRDELLRMGCDQAVRSNSSNVRTVLRGADFDVGKTTGPATNRVAAVMRNAGITFEYPLPGGKRIGEATIADLDAAIAFHEGQSAGHQRQIKIYAQVRAALKKSGKATVRDAIPETRLAEILRSAA